MKLDHLRALALSFLVLGSLAPPPAAQEPPSATAIGVPTDQEPLEVLKARVRPLNLEEAEEELRTWLATLEAKSKEVAGVEVAALRADDVAAIEQLNERAVTLRSQRSSLAKRVEVLIDAVEKKGGDVEPARAYVDSIAEVPPVTGWMAAMATVRAWMSNPDGGIAVALTLGGAVLILLGAWVVSILLARVAQRLLERSQHLSVLLRTFLVTGVKRTVLALGLVIAVSRLGVNMGPMLAAIGAAGLVIGLALQGTLSNFASGLMIMIYRPFDVGDVVSTSGVLGKVEGMTLVTTSICTFDNQAISIPNNSIWGDVITNLTAKNVRRVDMKFGVGYGDDFAAARDVLLDIVQSHAKVLSDPAPVVQVHELGDSSVNFVVRPWTKTEDYWQVYWDVTAAVKRRFDEEGISIPFPQRDVHFYPDASRPLALEAPAAVLQPASRSGAREKEGTQTA